MPFDYKHFWKTKLYESDVPEWQDKLLPYIHGSRVLDLGCGGGRFTPLFKDRKYLGVDLSVVRTYEAQQRYPEVTFMVGDVIDLNFPDNSFDLIFTSVTLQHIIPEEIQRVADKMKDWSKQIVMVETIFNKAPDYCFSHNYESLFNIVHAEALAAQPEGITYLFVHESEA